MFPQAWEDRQGASAWACLFVPAFCIDPRPCARIPCLRVAQRPFGRLRFATVESHIGTVCWRPDMLRQSKQARTLHLPPGKACNGNMFVWGILPKEAYSKGGFASGGGGDTVSPKWMDCSITEMFLDEFSAWVLTPNIYFKDTCSMSNCTCLKVQFIALGAPYSSCPLCHSPSCVRSCPGSRLVTGRDCEEERFWGVWKKQNDDAS